VKSIVSVKPTLFASTLPKPHKPTLQPIFATSESRAKLVCALPNGSKISEAKALSKSLQSERTKRNCFKKFADT